MERLHGTLKGGWENMKCEDCSSEARYFINVQMVPQCERCMIESLCSVPTQVISREDYEEVQRGKGKDYPRAS